MTAAARATTASRSTAAVATTALTSSEVWPQLPSTPPDFCSAGQLADCSSYREVERLRARIRDLERRLKAANAGDTPTPPLTPNKPWPRVDDTLEYYETRISASEGVNFSDHVNLHDIHYYGPFSSRSFTNELASFLAAALHHPVGDIQQPDDPASALVPVGGLASLSLEDQISCDCLNKTQQDYFLDLFCAHQHTLFPLIDASEFRLHYESLWSKPSLEVSFRRSSPLVDIVLALSIQLGAALIHKSKQAGPTDLRDSRLAGRMYFQRSHALLAEENKTASITAVQCYTYSVLYLANAGMMNSAQLHLTTAIQMAYAIGLHHEPPEHLSSTQQELRRRLWWTLYTLDSTTGMDLGRPWLTHLTSTSTRLPNDSLEVAQALATDYISPSSDNTWLSYHSHVLRLVNTIRTILAAFRDKSGDIMSETKTKSFYKEAQAREKCARFLSDCAKRLRVWTQDVPSGLKIRRYGGGDAFSTDTSPLELDFSAPTWLQVQRISLALRYHKHAMDLYRPFICFTSSAPSSSFTPLSDNNAISCLNHAVAITNIIHQTFAETDLLSGFHCIFQYQQSATTVAAGFACASPFSPHMASARQALATAIQFFDRFDATAYSPSPFSTSVNLARDLGARVDAIVDAFRNGFSSQPTTTTITVTSSSVSSSSLSTSPFVSAPPTTALLESSPSSSLLDHHSLLASPAATTTTSTSNPSSTIGSPHPHSSSSFGNDSLMVSAGIDMALGSATAGAEGLSESVSWMADMGQVMGLEQHQQHRHQQQQSHQQQQQQEQQLWHGVDVTTDADLLMREFGFSPASTEMHGDVHQQYGHGFN